jgi:hypothetical protein
MSLGSRLRGAARPLSAVQLGRRRSQRVLALAALSIRLVEIEFLQRSAWRQCCILVSLIERRTRAEPNAWTRVWAQFWVSGSPTSWLSVLGSICSAYGLESTRTGISELVFWNGWAPTKSGKCIAVAQPGLWGDSVALPCSITSISRLAIHFLV